MERSTGLSPRRAAAVMSATEPTVGALGADFNLTIVRTRHSAQAATTAKPLQAVTKIQLAPRS